MSATQTKPEAKTVAATKKPTESTRPSPELVDAFRVFLGGQWPDKVTWGLVIPGVFRVNLWKEGERGAVVAASHLIQVAWKNGNPVLTVYEVSK